MICSGFIKAAVLSCAAVCVGCAQLAPAPDSQQALVERTAQSHLLLVPSKEPELLLGRAVRLTSDGAWTIAGTRSPGCEVRVHREPAVFRTRRRVGIESTTVVSAGYAQLIGLSASKGRATEAEIDIENSAVLRADTRGECGDVIVDSVYIGRGRRALLSRGNAAAQVGAAGGLVGVGASQESKTSVLDDVSWAEEQGYGFTYKHVSAAPALKLSVETPGVLRDGEEVTVKLRASRRAFAVVYYLGANGEGSVLWPSSEEPSPELGPRVVAELPSERERELGTRLRARLENANEAVTETLVVYAFTERSDFEQLKPAVGETEGSGADYAARLTQRLESVPLRRWARAAVTYQIVPAVR